MAIRFCEKCSGMLVPRTINNETLMLCNRCGWFKILKNEKLELSSKNTFSHDKKGEGAVSDKNVLATYDNLCKKCGYDKAQVIDVGILYSDEDYLILLKCGKCGHAERVGKKAT